MAKILIANRLTDGLVVFYAVGGNWVESISAGQVTFDDAAADRLLTAGLADEHGNQVIDPRLIDVTETAGEFVPAVLREAIRAQGPTIAVERTF